MCTNRSRGGLPVASYGDLTLELGEALALARQFLPTGPLLEWGGPSLRVGSSYLYAPVDQRVVPSRTVAVRDTARATRAGRRTAARSPVSTVSTHQPDQCPISGIIVRHSST
jgi:hypothetical protein